MRLHLVGGPADGATRHTDDVPLLLRIPHLDGTIAVYTLEALHRTCKVARYRYSSTEPLTSLPGEQE
jgi:hypothetical protein